MSKAEQIVSKCHSLSARVATHSRRTLGELDAFAEDFSSLSHALDNLEKSLLNSKASNNDEKKSINNELHLIETGRGVLNGNGPGGDLKQKLCSYTNPILIKFLLGSKAKVLVMRPEDAQALKMEYHSFRDNVAVFLVIFPILLLLCISHEMKASPNLNTLQSGSILILGVQIFIVMMSYIYVALAFRENVLIVNGSRIRAWWIWHHYLSIIACLMILSLPMDSPIVTMFLSKFIQWSLFQGIVMIVQNRYQRRRMYTRIAMGKDSVMDVVISESSGARGNLILLYPLLLILQLWQFYIGIKIFRETVCTVMSLVCYNDFNVYNKYLAKWTLIEEETHVNLDDVGNDFNFPFINAQVKRLGCSFAKTHFMDKAEDDRGYRGIFALGVLFIIMAILNFFYTFLILLMKRPKRNRHYKK